MAHMHVNWSIYISPYWKCCLSLATGWPDFRCAYRRAVKNWKRRQIFYPCAALRRPLKHCLFMYNRETFKIIGFSLSILFFSFSFPFFTHTYTHTCTHQPSEGKVKSLLCNLSADWRALNRALQSRETLVEFHLRLLINAVYWWLQSGSWKTASAKAVSELAKAWWRESMKL